MNVDEVRKYCIALPEATENLQWGDDLCFKIGGKIFATLALTAVPQKLCFKCSVETFAELVEREDIRPAPYVGRYHWVILDRLDALRSDELKDLIGRSYQMVAAKAPKAKLRPSHGKKKRRAPTTVEPRDRAKKGRAKKH